MNRTILWGLSLTALLMLFACSGSDSSDENGKPNNRKWLFTLDGQSAHAGDTIHILHTATSKVIIWQDENDPINRKSPVSNQYNTYMEIVSGGATYDQVTLALNGFCFFSYPCLNKFILHDYSSEPSRDYDIYVDVQPIDLVGKIDIKGTILGYYDSENGKDIAPFLIFYIDEELRKNFIGRERIGTSQDGLPLMHDVAASYFKIIAFGSNRETCYPSSNDWGWFTEYKKVSNYSTSNGECFYGKITTSDVNYYFFKFDYGNYSYEVRKYMNSDTCLWNGEWENK